MPDITLYFLQASRSFRIAWLLEEMHLPYTLKFFNRNEKMQAPPEFKSACGNSLGKAPTLKDGDLVVGESGAIVEYLCEMYDKDHKYIPKEIHQRMKVLQWIHSAEATFLLHGLAITYTRLNLPDAAKEAGYLEPMEEKLAVNVQNDLDWLEAELQASKGRFLCGDEVTAADVMVHFSVDYILKMEIGTKGRRWGAIEKWLADCEGLETYQTAVKKTGHEHLV